MTEREFILKELGYMEAYYREFFMSKITFSSAMKILTNIPYL